jgi:flagellar protein FliJ
MKKFRFKLEAVERHRKLQEQEKQAWLSKCLQKMRNTEKVLLDLDMREVKARRAFSALGSPDRREPVSAANFWVLDQFIRGQKLRRTDVKNQLEQDEIEVGAAYTAFLHARKEKKIMEKLREKKFHQYKEDAVQAELLVDRESGGEE